MWRRFSPGRRTVLRTFTIPTGGKRMAAKKKAKKAKKKSKAKKKAPAKKKSKKK